MRKEVTMEPGVRGLFVKAKARERKYHDWILLVSHVAIETRNINDVVPINMVYCYGCKNMQYNDSSVNEVSKIHFSFGDASHYRFYKATEEEKKVIINMLKAKKLKYIKVINKVVDR